MSVALSRDFLRSLLFRLIEERTVTRSALQDLIADLNAVEAYIRVGDECGVWSPEDRQFIIAFLRHVHGCGRE